MKNTILSCLLFSLSSCSYFEKRHSHFKYVSKGASKDQIIQRSGDPDRVNMSKDKEILTYRYCDVPYHEEAIFGLITLGAYNITCERQFKYISIILEQDKVVGRVDNADPNTYVNVNAEMSGN
jgi:hypothetical protein